MARRDIITYFVTTGEKKYDLSKKYRSKDIVDDVEFEVEEDKAEAKAEAKAEEKDNE